LNILTFNIVDWFHSYKNRNECSAHIWKTIPSRVEVNTEFILDKLQESNLKATFFVLGWVAEYYPSLIKKIHNAGHEIGALSNWYHRASKLVPSDFEKDLVLCLSKLENIIGEKVEIYRAPGFSLQLEDQWAFEILNSNGIRIDSSVALSGFSQKSPIIIDTEASQIVELPLVKSIFGIPYTGDSYFRAMPKFVYNSLFNEKKTGINNDNYRLFYFYPHDFGQSTPRSNLYTLYKNELIRYNTDISMNRLMQILDTEGSYTIVEAANRILNKV
jgi:peptidoglycan-N-acetylglucosamine deacetylase